MQTAIIWDRDGTLASVDYVRPTAGTPDAWRQFNAALPFDAPVPGLADAARLMPKLGIINLMVSGRMEGDHPGDRRRRFQLQDWYAKHGIPYHKLYMREGGDYRIDSVVKAEMYERYIKPFYRVQLVVDDRPQVIEMWKSKGLRVWTVSDPGILPPIARQRS